MVVVAVSAAASDVVVAAIVDVASTSCVGGATRVAASVIVGAGVDDDAGFVTISARKLRQYHDFC